jgi:hypothetical protein
MANPIRIKRRTSGASGAPSSMLNAELAFNEVDSTLYYGFGDTAGSASSILAIAGPGAFLTLSSTQTITGDKTFSGSLFAVTQTGSDNSTKVATTAFVTSKLSNLTNVVNTFNTRTGNVTLTSSDVTTALTYTPLANTNPSVTGTLAVSGDTTITGNLTVNGTTVTINSTTMNVDDKNIELGAVATPTDTTADGGGITLKGATDKTINWFSATGAWTLSEHVTIASGKEYRINGVSVLTSSALGSGVTGSSLTSVGTIATGTWQGTAVGLAYGGTGATTASAARTNLGLAIGTDILGTSTTIDGGTF